MDQNTQERIQYLIDNSFLKEYLELPHVTDISYNGTKMLIQDNIKGRYVAENQPEYKKVVALGKKIANEMGKEFANNDPILDTELAYLRVNFVHEAISPSGCTFSIRISRPEKAINDLSELANEDVAQLLKVLIKAETNIIIAGRTGTGKTELQKLLVEFIPDNKKITLIEDTMDSHIKELYPNKDINSWRILTDDVRDKKITYHDLIKAGLRNNPDWLIIAETRGSEAYDMVESALTDHSIITTIHAKKAEAIPRRLISMIGQKYQVNEILLGKDIAKTLSIGIYLDMKETKEGIKRYIREIVEFTDFTEQGVSYIPIYSIEKTFNNKTEKYDTQLITNPLSEERLNEIAYKGLYHLVPNPFKENTDKKSSIRILTV